MKPVKLLFRLCCSWTRIKLWCWKPPSHRFNLFTCFSGGLDGKVKLHDRDIKTVKYPNMVWILDQRRFLDREFARIKTLNSACWLPCSPPLKQQSDCRDVVMCQSNAVTTAGSSAAQKVKSLAKTLKKWIIFELLLVPLIHFLPLSQNWVTLT